ncbi:MAG: response regulator, partial [Chloroflexi bacterium]|nr:response regulator [Chloroflexota bacterium]
EQADQMQGLITDLLDVARIGAGTLALYSEPSDVAALVERARTTFLSGSARHDIQIDLAADLPRVMADRRRIGQVLGNLLENAARHSPAGAAIRVGGRAAGVQVELLVSDDGVGISPERLPQLFRRFSLHDGGERSDWAGGSGLGLAVCKGIVEAHGGRIRAESDGVGLGARFTFTLPAVEEVEPVETAPRAHSAQNRGRRIRVLTVDDDPQALRYVRDTLTEAGYTAMVTGDPEAVDTLIREEKPHLVLLDLMLPGADGIELMESVPELSQLPVIFLSAYGRDQVIARALEAGADDYIVKPFSPTELVARIQAALRRRTPAERPEPCVVGDLVVDFAARRVTLRGRAVDLTDIEYRVLAELAANVGRVALHTDILRRVWGPTHAGGTGPVRNIVKNLRRKLGDGAENPTYIFNEPRIGYRLGQPDESGC